MEVVGETKTIFDTGTTQIIGDPARIEDFFTPLVLFYGAEPAPQYGAGIYTSTWASRQVVLPIRRLTNIFLSQSLAISILPSPLLLEGRKSRFLLNHLTLGPYPRALILALLAQPLMGQSRVVSWPLITLLGDIGTMLISI